MVEPREELHPGKMVGAVDRQGVFRGSWCLRCWQPTLVPRLQVAAGHPRSCQEPSDARLALGELATEAVQQENASFRARWDNHTAAATTPPFQRDPAPAKPCPVQDSHRHRSSTATSLHSHVGTNADSLFPNCCSNRLHVSMPQGKSRFKLLQEHHLMSQMGNRGSHARQKHIKTTQGFKKAVESPRRVSPSLGVTGWSPCQIQGLLKLSIVRLGRIF